MHGDDYCNPGPSNSSDWLQMTLEKRHEINTQKLGTGKDFKGNGKKREGQLFNMVIRHTKDGDELDSE